MSSLQFLKQTKIYYFRGRIYYTEMYDMLKNMDPPLGFGSKCPDRLAFKKLIRMNQPIDDEGMVHFTTTLFALIRENLSIKMRAAEEMDQADFELRQTIIKVWPYEGKEKIDLLVPPREGTLKCFILFFVPPIHIRLVNLKCVQKVYF